MKRVNIGIFGRVNSGKSTLMNLLTQQETSIVDNTPGTTADVKTTIMEIHDLGPVKIFDSAGIDEKGELGRKKKDKSFDALKRSDIVLLVINGNNRDCIDDDFLSEKEILSLSEKREKEVFIIFNKFRKSGHLSSLITSELIKGTNCPVLEIELIDRQNYSILVDFIKSNSKFQFSKTPLLPALTENKIAFLNIPIDEESPEGRFLRPQMMVEEYLVRRYIPTFAYRMNLGKARSAVVTEVEEERKRFEEFINLLNENGKLQILLTDSQAMDIISKWTANADFFVTTFSVVMINYLSGGKLNLFVDGIRTFQSLKEGDRVMIAEGCNHDRKGEDIGTVQIPRKINELFGENTIRIDHYFGRIFATEKKLEEYKLVIHCGGCMLDEQTISSRIDDLIASKVSFTNYGLLLSYFEGEDVLNRVIKPFALRL